MQEELAREIRGEVADAWGEWIAEMRDWDVFGGLTFDQKRVTQERLWGRTWVGRRISRDTAITRFKRWIRDVEGAVGRPVDYVAALEYQRNGWPHLHPLLDMGGLGPGDIERAGRLWFKRNGGNKLSRPRNTLRVARYAAKYLAKDLSSGDVLLSPRLAFDRTRKQLVQDGAGR